MSRRAMVLVDVDDAGEVTFTRWKTLGGREVEVVALVRTDEDHIHVGDENDFAPQWSKSLRWLGAQLLGEEPERTPH